VIVDRSPLVSVLIPTLPERAAMLAQVVEGFEADTVEVEVLTCEGRSWGGGVNELAGGARGGYWLTCCDDTVPLPGWFRNARVMLDGGAMPASRYLDLEGRGLKPEIDEAPHGTPLPWSRSFLWTPGLYERLGPMLDLTWWTDIEYSERIVDAGIPIRACEGFSFTHLAGERTWLTDEEHDRQRETYEQARAAKMGAVRV
jgi:hypothetical protein